MIRLLQPLEMHTNLVYSVIRVAWYDLLRPLVALWVVCDKLKGNGDYDGAADVRNVVVRAVADEGLEDRQRACDGDVRDQMFQDGEQILSNGSDSTVDSASDVVLSGGALWLLLSNRLIRDAVVAAASAPNARGRYYVTRLVHNFLMSLVTTCEAFYASFDALCLEQSNTAETGVRISTKGGCARSSILRFQRLWSGDEIPAQRRAEELGKRFRESLPVARRDPHVSGICFPDIAQCRPFCFYGATGTDGDVAAQDDCCEDDCDVVLAAGGDPAALNGVQPRRAVPTSPGRSAGDRSGGAVSAVRVL